MLITTEHARNIDPFDQPGDLLATKLSAPILHSMLVRRARLTDMLWTSMQRRLTLVTAPAGYGKSTLLGEWIAGVAAANWPVCWVSLDSYDNDPVRFWSYIVATLRTVFPELEFNVKIFIHDPCQDNDCTRLNHLLNQIAAAGRHFSLILDDFHDIQDEAVHRSLAYFIEKMPDNCHMIIASRLPPPFPVARLRARKQLVEIEARHLSFTREEGEAFLTQVMKLDLTWLEIEALMEKTEGWIAGLQLAALSMQGKNSNHDFLSEFSMGQKHILEYLTEEVLNQQSDEIKEFLLKTSILEKLTPPLCDALLQRSDSRAVLETLEQRNLFLIPLDGQRHWYRYHALFGDLLRKQLLGQQSEIVIELHHQAYQWLMANDFPEQAVMHALAAGNTRLAAETVESCALQAIIRMDITAVVSWFKLLPQEIRSQRLRLAIYEGLVNLNQGKVNDLEERLAFVEKRLAATPPQEIEPEEAERLSRYVRSMRAAVLCTLGDFDRGLDFSQQMMESLRPEDYYFYGLLEHYMAYAYHAAGRLSDATEALEQACHNALSHDLFKEFVISKSEKARFYRLQGRLREAAQEYTLAIEFAEAHHVGDEASVIPHAGLAEILREWNRIDEADNYLVEPMAFLLKSPGKILDWYLMVDVCLAAARNRLLHDDLTQATQMLHMARQSMQAFQFIPELVPEVNSARVDLWLASGDLAAALAWAEEKFEHFHQAGKERVPSLEQLAMARAFLAHNQLDNAETLINNLLGRLANGEQKEQLVRAYILKAVLQWQRGWHEAAAFTIGQSIKLSLPEQRVRSYLDEGSAMRALLTNMHSTRRPSRLAFSDDEKASFLHIAEQMNVVIPSAPAPAMPQAHSEPVVISPMIEALSERELQILLLLARGLSAGDIARELVISINTSKAHIKNIYQKLEVHTRSEAINKAVYYQILKV